MLRSEMATRQIMHCSLTERRVKNSRYQDQDTQHDPQHVGTIILSWTKETLSYGQGLLVTSMEALLDVAPHCTHMTFNPVRFAYYLDKARHVFGGNSVDNTQQLNVFLVDIDFHHGLKPAWTAARQKMLAITDDLKPTLVMSTPHGYQVIYILEEPAYVKRHQDGSLPVVDAGRKIAKALKAYLNQKMPEVDCGCNDFGFGRVPHEDNILFYDPQATSKFADWLTWSKQQAKQQSKQSKHGWRKLKSKFRNLKKAVPQHLFQAHRPRQVQQAWYLAALQVDQVPESGKGAGIGRHNFLLTLALANQSSHVPFEKAYDELDEWNSRNVAPLEAAEFNQIMHDAYAKNDDGEYQYHGATHFYIHNIRTNYLTEKLLAQVPKKKFWYKYAKPRDQRDYSHYSEWAADLKEYIKQHAARESGFLETSFRQLQAELKISAESLNQVKKSLQAKGELTVTTIGRGRYAVTRWATPTTLARSYDLALRDVQDAQEQQQLNWQHYLTRFTQKLRLTNQAFLTNTQHLMQALLQMYTNLSDHRWGPPDRAG